MPDIEVPEGMFEAAYDAWVRKVVDGLSEQDAANVRKAVCGRDLLGPEITCLLGAAIKWQKENQNG